MISNLTGQELLKHVVRFYAELHCWARIVGTQCKDVPIKELDWKTWTRRFADGTIEALLFFC
jgi:hypothetical protein